MAEESAQPTAGRVEALFHAALGLARADRPAYLAAACGNDLRLRQRVEGLLSAYEAPESFLPEKPADPVASLERVVAYALRHDATDSGADLEGIGQSISHYKLLERIGEGGCGVVYMAEQTEPVRRRVALKIIKLGMDTKQVVARFEAERQALALMDHPNIAKVLDAGATETGRPYFVMELVRGIKITDFCDQKELSTRERLDLFVQVCRAVQHAHQKGVIHRDLKPSNILVTVNDGVAVPKVIDFGIAKATNQQVLTDKTIFTAFEQFLGTPAYMSPEQAAMTSVDVDTRSDIYSLGVLLYELLTDRTPFDAQELLRVGLDEMRRTIREQEPPRPSTRLSALGGGELTTTAKRRGLEPFKLLSLLRGDLDWIVMKCLEKERARRYETANGLARDIERHLSHEPIAARPPSELYRLQKLIRRNVVIFAAAVGVGASLLIGFAVSTWMYFQEREAKAEQARLRLEAQGKEQKAQIEAAKKEQVAEFLKDMLRGVDSAVALGRDTTLLREILDKTAQRIGKDLTNQPEVEAELEQTLAEVYKELGRAQEDEALRRRVLALLRSLPGDHRGRISGQLMGLGQALWGQDRPVEGEKAIREGLELMQGLQGSEREHIAECLNMLGLVVRDQGRKAEAESIFRQAIAVSQNSHWYGALLHSLAYTLADDGKLDEAEKAYREAVERDKNLVNQYTADLLENFARTLAAEDKHSEAVSYFRQGLAMRQKLFGPDSPSVTPSLLSLAGGLTGLATSWLADGRFEEADAPAREALSIREAKAPDDWRTFNTRSVLGGSLCGQKRYAEAEPLLVSGFEGMSRQLSGIPPAALARVTEAAHRLVQFYQATGAHTEAEKWTAAEAKADAEAKAAARVATLRQNGHLHARHGRFDEAAAELGEVIRIDPTGHEVWHWLAAILIQTRQRDAWSQHCHNALERFGTTQDPLVAERIAKDCLALPDVGADLPKAAQLADTAVAATKNSAHGWFELVKGLAEYRQGHFESAATWARKVVTPSTPEPSPDRYLLPQGWFLLSMALSQGGRPDDSRRALTNGVEIARTRLPNPAIGDWGGSWMDLIMVDTLMNEAKALSEGLPLGQHQ